MRAINPDQFYEALKELYDKGLPSGDLSGWPSVDALYSVAPGQLSIVTGYPGSGKSEWVDALMLRLAKKDWMFAVYSPENLPHELHISKWAEKLTEKPFGSGPNPRVTWAEVEEALARVSRRFTFIASVRETPNSLDAIMETATEIFDNAASVRKCGLVIDPWNELEHGRPREISETEYISYSLSKLRAWARDRKIHVWIVAHPQKLKRTDEGKLPVPTPDSISGSQHWWNKADCCITVHRDMSKKLDNSKANPDVEIHVQKIRFKHIGTPGMAILRYNRITGDYYEGPRAV